MSLPCISRNHPECYIRRRSFVSLLIPLTHNCPVICQALSTGSEDLSTGSALSPCGSHLTKQLSFLRMTELQSSGVLAHPQSLEYVISNNPLLALPQLYFPSDSSQCIKAEMDSSGSRDGKCLTGSTKMAPVHQKVRILSRQTTNKFLNSE